METEQKHEEVYVTVSRYNSKHDNQKVHFKSVNISEKHKKVLDLAESTLKEFEDLENKLKGVSDQIKENCDITKSYADNFYDNLNVRDFFLDFFVTILRTNLHLTDDLTKDGKVYWEYVVEEVMSKSIKNYDFSKYTSSDELYIKNFFLLK